jgi:septal ring factor EnvC (AmiA/AmiB activator)
MIKKLFAAFIGLIIVVSGFSQDTKEDIQRKQQELQKEIDDLNRTLGQIKSSRKQSLTQLALVKKKIAARTELINNINRDLRRLSDNIYNNQIEINHLKIELDSLKDNYAKSLVFAYKNRSSYDYLNFIFSATSFNDAIKRIAYLKSYKQYRETQVSTIEKTQGILQGKISTLTSAKVEKNAALTDQGKQLNVLQEDKKEQNDVLKGLKSRETDIAGQIKQNQRDQQKLKGALAAIINREIAEEKRKEAARLKALEEQKKKDAAAAAAANNNNESSNTAKTNTPSATTTNSNNASNAGTTAAKSTRTYNVLESTDESLSNSINFESNRGKLPWPVNSGIVSIPFGRYQVPGTNLWGNSDGITITLPVGSSVKAVAEGEVRAVFDIGGPQVVVVRHGKYFTAYSNLTNIKVSTGSQVHAGTVLGNADKGQEGDGEITFMVENSSGGYLNPESWLRPQ